MGLFYKHLDYYKEANSDTIKLRFGNSNLILTREKDFYSEILGSKQEDFVNSTAFKLVFGYFFPNSVIVVDGDQWQKIRKIITKAMNKTSFELLTPSIIKSLHYVLDDSDQERSSSNNDQKGKILANQMCTIDMISRITFDAFHCLVYEWDPETLRFNPESSKILDSCSSIVRSIGERFIYPTPLLWKLPTKKNREYIEANKYLKIFVNNFIMEQKETLRTHKEEVLNKKQRTLLQEMLLANEMEEAKEGRLTHEELVDQICTLFFAGFDTTSSVLSFALNFLSRNPDIQIKLRKDLWEAFPNGEEDIVKGGVHAVESVSYLKHFIEEIHRIRPLLLLVRDCIRDTEINGYPVKKGDSVIVDNVGLGVKLDNWNFQSDLDEFKPERWQTFKPQALEAPMPFGFGGRICPGRRLASFEIKIFLAVALLHHVVRLRNPEEKMKFTWDLGFSLIPGTGNIDFHRI
eukprot:CAMPEP_0170519818 /NCGR_PEP_ID=MMETSP0209-20121228/5088_1 /TAXON_ID=665100 ORGANISM="Litonotus pictus, Strain P1" /NCGR_SAMPLE_ID=MMETSP0209 /ASSEMBLY_ACC=CAM_ASM_000301 /LENGTH=461 /DNA_ID=CAMNT_0010805789 /DNA_START=118 /DNA_END=1503 /DNA_ORIENTATION=+